jgi:hypothetical protein
MQYLPKIGLILPLVSYSLLSVLTDKFLNHQIMQSYPHGQLQVMGYQFTKISGSFQEILQIELDKINKIPKGEVNLNYGYYLEMYSEGGGVVLWR